MDIVLSILFVVSVLSSIYFYHVGKFNGAKESALVIKTLAGTFKDMFDALGKQSQEQTMLVCKIVENKDIIITSLQKETTDLRAALEEIEMHASIEDDEDDDIEEEDVVIDEDIVAVHKGKITGVSMEGHFEQRASVLHEQLQTTAKMLEEVKDKMPSDAYILLSSMLQLDKTKVN